MTIRRLLGERVVVKVAGCAPRDGVLIAGVQKNTSYIQKFPVRFPNGNVTVYRSDQLLLRGSRAPPMEYIRVGDIAYTKRTLGVIRFIGLHEDFAGTIIVLEPMDPKLPADPSVESFRRLFPSATLSDSTNYLLLRGIEEIIKLLSPDVLLQQLSKLRDRYTELISDRKEKTLFQEEDLERTDKRIEELEIVKENLVSKRAMSPKHRTKDKKGAEPPNSPLTENEPVTTSILFHPGRLGIRAVWMSGKIEQVTDDGQAQRYGVQPGWIITHIDGEEYHIDGLDAKTRGDKDILLTFEIPKNGANPSTETQAPVPPSDTKDIMFLDVQKDIYERKIQELKDKVKDYQGEVQTLVSRKKELEDEHKEVTRLQVKVETLRTSRQMFMNQAKTTQKKMVSWKDAATEFEEKCAKLIAEHGHKLKSVEAGKIIQPPARRGSVSSRGGVSRRGSVKGGNQSEQETFIRAGKPGRGKRRPSLKMPTPEPGNTLKLGE